MLERRNALAHRLLTMFATEKEHKRRFVQMSVAQVIAQDTKREEGHLSLTKTILAGTLFFTSFGLLTLFKHFFDAKSENKDVDKPGTDASQNTVAPQPVASTNVSPLVAGMPINPIKTAKASDEVKAAIRIAAQANNTDFKLLYGIAGAESSFRTAVKAGSSSAQGLFQFTESTWSYLTNKFYPGLKFKSSDRNDPEKSARVAGLYVNTIVDTLTRNLGRKPSYGETYLGYFLGPTGVVNFMQALQRAPSSIGAKLFPRAARANPNVFYSGGDTSKPLTLVQILATQEGKIHSYAQSAPDASTDEVASANPTHTTKVEIAPSITPKPSRPNIEVASSVNLPKNAKSKPINYAKALPQTPSVSDASSIVKEPTKTDSEQVAQASSGQAFIASSGGKSKPQGYVIRGSDGRLYNMQTG